MDLIVKEDETLERVKITEEELNRMDRYIYTISETKVSETEVNISVGYLYRERSKP